LSVVGVEMRAVRRVVKDISIREQFRVLILFNVLFFAIYQFTGEVIYW